MTHDIEQDRLERAREGRTLARADQDITEGERRVAAQLLLIEQLRADGHDTRLAEKLLAGLEATLTEWRTHRELIIQRIAQLNSRLL
ncbi:MAG TPA: hypothetical protein VHN20_10450 [Beijerinckiaceae bacterium]|nr:hypothetical protein [Beijerinckiaceae bacterium]